MACDNTVTPEKQYLRGNINICRLCGDSKNFKKVTLIFGKAERENQINECIKRTLDIDITEDEEPECKVCRSCQGLLKRFDEFKATAIETHEIENDIQKDVLNPLLLLSQKKDVVMIAILIATRMPH